MILEISEAVALAWSENCFVGTFTFFCICVFTRYLKIFKSEDTEGFLLLQKHKPNLYPKLLHPVHGNPSQIISPNCVHGMAIRVVEF